jgi:hypothetical protein
MKIRDVLKVLKKRVKIRSLLVLILLLSFNSFAWLIFATKVSGGMSAYVSSWNIEFRAGSDQTETNMNFDVGRIYPGMQTYTKEITVKNNGEISAKLSYEIKKIQILGDTYEVNETTTSDDLLNRLQNEYPFKIKIAIDNGSELAENTTSTFTISLEWPYESGNDDVDTFWGEKAYQYYTSNVNENSFHIEIKLEAVQG